jgi:hypothetical protein
VIILLGNGILGCKPDILLGIQGKVKACSGKAHDRSIHIVLALQDARSLKIKYGFSFVACFTIVAVFNIVFSSLYKNFSYGDYYIIAYFYLKIK